MKVRTMQDQLTRRFPFLDRLNEQQRMAVEHIDGPSLVVAGAGSGKTTVLTTKIAYMLECGVEPWNILALTFTNKAAREMRDRIERMVGHVKSASLWMGTFHSIFSRILRKEGSVLGFMPNYTIYQPSDTKSMLKSICREMGLDDKVYKISFLANRISEAKNMLYTPKNYRENTDAIGRDKDDNIPLFCDIYNEYFNRCHQANAMDFDDMLLFTYILFDCCPDIRKKYADKFQYVLVDEFQDTNFAQFSILRQIAQEHNNICVVGDDAQSIYGFRGAQIDNILTFDKFFADTKLFKLEQNYRSTQTIVNAANSLIHKNQGQIPKIIYSKNEEGSPLILNELTSDIEEGEMIAGRILDLHRQGMSYSDIAILYRTNGQSRILEETLRKRSIPYIIYGSHSFYDKKEVRDVMAYLRMTVNESDEEALRRIINVPTRGIGETTIRRVFECAKEHDTQPWNVVQEPDLYGLNVNNGTKSKLQTFASMIKDFQQCANVMDAYQLGQKVLKDSGLFGLAQADLSSEGRETMDNYSSLLSGMSQFVQSQLEQGYTQEITMTDYLNEVSLLTDSDKSDPDGDAVRMMTVHIAKGLEFDVVFIAGLEQDLFPSAQCFTLREKEEERRLFFVAITRAKKRCYLSNAKTRFRFGKSDWYEPSEFIGDIDSKYIYQESSNRVLLHKNLDEYADFFESGMGFPSSRYSKKHYPTEGRSSMAFTKKSQSEMPMVGVGGRSSLSNAKSLGVRHACEASLDAQSRLTANVSNGQISSGSQVEHATFGLGTVIRIEDNTTGLKAVINFNNCGEKTLLLKFAKLKVID